MLGADKNLIDVFKVVNTKSILARDIIPNSGKAPYITASAENNSVSTYIRYDEKLKDQGNCAFIGGKTFVVSYQSEDFYSNDSHNLALYLKDENNSIKDNLLFLATCVEKGLKHKYSWGDSVSNRKIQKDKITAPIKNKHVDYSFMETFISAIKKLVIKNLVLYTDQKIGAAKKF